jgi:hypothetical protein
VCASANTCKTRCAGDGDCLGGTICNVATGNCRQPGKDDGAPCATDGECASTHCADHVCCNIGCTGTCRACVQAQTGKPNGTCADVMAGTKDDRCAPEAPSTCGRDGTCDGNGKCRPYANGTPCGTECCRDNGGPGGGNARVCAFECQAGTCDRAHPMVTRCGGAQCCCATNGNAMCTLGIVCPGTCM